ncbi:MAG: TetR/AcrR family transcriptional regulator [Coriobacteriales bacterium]
MPDKLNPRTQRARDALLAATRKLVGERPASEISLTEIAEEAGVSRPTVYNQFSDTPTLVAATAEQLMRSIFNAIDAELPVEDNEEYLARLMEMFVNAVYEERAFSRNAMYGPSSTAITASVVELLSNRMGEGFVGNRLRASGEDIDDRLDAISGGVIWMLTRWLDSDFKDENAPAKMARRFSDTILELSR